MTDIACPKCRLKDQVQKVSSVYSGGKSDTTVSGPISGTAYVDGKSGSTTSHGFLSGSSITIKAQELSPPPEPTKEKGYGCFAWGLIIFFGFAGIVGLGGLFAPPEELGLRPLFLLITPGIPIYFAVNHFRIRARSESRYKVEMPLWNEAIRRWDLLYYCHRDDVVYFQGTPNFTPAISMNDLLYD